MGTDFYMMCFVYVLNGVLGGCYTKIFYPYCIYIKINRGMHFGFEIALGFI